ncbi:alpha/beta hydrolase [Limnohabitans sp.]|uniref:alpha/beta fold hydrolase n=1 Tax=Limnohabitans sp. TaxID=1907725 RepID=UPI003120057E
MMDVPDFIEGDLRIALTDGQRLVTEVDGVTVVWHSWGEQDSATVVLLHGGSGSWLHWVRNIAALRDAGWRVLVPDLPGFGDSDLPPGCVDVDALSSYLHDGLQQLAPKGPVQLVGFSFGGMTAGLWLQAYPQDAHALVLVGAPGMGLQTAVRTPLKGWRHLATSEAQEEIHKYNLMALMFQNASALDSLALALHTANVHRDRMPRRRLSSTDILARALPDVQVPVSAIYGEHDALYRERLPEVQGAMQMLCGQWNRWTTVSGAGHWVQYEAAQAFNAALIQTLSDQA